MLITLKKKIPNTKFIIIAGATATKNNASNEPGRPTINLAGNKNAIPLINVPIGKIIIDTIRSCVFSFIFFQVMVIYSL